MVMAVRSIISAPVGAQKLLLQWSTFDHRQKHLSRFALIVLACDPLTSPCSLLIDFVARSTGNHTIASNRRWTTCLIQPEEQLPDQCLLYLEHIKTTQGLYDARLLSC